MPPLAPSATSLPVPAARVLLVENCFDDERITLRALRRSGLPLDVRVARDDREADAAIGGDGGGEVPDLVLLSLGLRHEAERGMLERARRDPRTAKTPIVVLASGVDPGVAARALAAGASAHATKPIDVDAYTRMVQTVVGRWLATTPE